ncbi:MAG: Ig-like domain-containing protein [Clostridia bacterium]|nr:Ig-like domain-containing protein [Clostridia bacterium]
MMKFNKFFNIIVITLLLSTLLLLCACDDTPTESRPEVSKAESREEVSETSTETSEKNPISIEDTITVFVGDSYQLEPQQSGATSSDFRYNTSNVNIATVTTKGVVTGKAVGETEIRIYGIDATINIKVVVVPKIDSITVNTEEISLTLGENFDIDYEITPEDATQPVRFSSNAELIATVDENGVVTAVAVGETTITVFANDNAKKTVTVKVFPKTEKIEFISDKLELPVTQSGTLEYKVTPIDSIEKKIFTSSDDSIVTVDENGNIVAKKDGTAEITLTMGSVSAKITVVVKNKDIPVEKITFGETDVTVIKGSNYELSWTISPKYPTNSTLTFESSNKKVATVDKNGVITGVAEGTATITAKAASGVKATVKVTVDGRKPSDKPDILEYSFLDSNRFILFGTCEDNAVVEATNGKDTIKTTADKKCFSISLPKTGSQTTVTITITADGKLASEPVTYTVNYKTPPSEQGSWSMLWGTNYWTFLTKHPGGDLGYKDIMRTNALSDAQINAFKTRVNQKVAALKKIKSDAELIYIIIPSPATIYTEELPSYIKPTNGVRRIDQIMAALAETDAKFVNVLDLFEAHKNDDLKMYWKLDTHWNDYGAYLVYNELFEMIDDKFPDASPHKFSDFNFKEDYYYGGDMTMYLKVPNYVVQEWNTLRVPKFQMHQNITKVQRYVSDKQLTYRDGIIDQKITVKTDRPELPTMVIYRDSYSAAIFDILADRCDASYWHAMWDYTLNVNEFKNVDADYAVILINERNISSILN